MKNFKLTSLILLVFLLSACNKDSLEVSPQNQTLVYSESLSFEMKGMKYVFDIRSGDGVGNRQINIKPYSSIISNLRWAYNTGNYFWYGENDSTLFDAHYGFSSRNERSGDAKISLSRKFHNDQLTKGFYQVGVPNDNSVLFKEGKQTFAVDLDKENTTDGIALEVSGIGVSGVLTSYMPGFSILVRPNLNKDIQGDSNFEITKVQKMDDDFFFIQAKFELNLYDDNGMRYRIENGLIQFKTPTAFK